ncbi:aldehyde dehydrogenase [Paenibacillus methanolicus]|uniref:Aldehyde dehydrogenase n=1 Tax=Paenibacillus methanolicus TaxID=582686 RepID=A0A5S5C253_9BACL|nr:aldehyde dehydrogenase [Paenibacillus methanolicus]TYP72506.1 aldehyde dehydrogenase (NAD+) [Paenibacillus methanolicus]
MNDAHNGKLIGQANDISSLVEKQKRFFSEGRTLSLEFRKEQLSRLKAAVKTYEQEILDALYADLNKAADEAFMTEIGLLYTEINEAIKRLRKWAKPKKVRTPLLFFGAKSYIMPEPYGTVLVIAPWNYPFQLAIAPIIGAIAAGNTVIVKPSELTPRVSAVLAKLFKSAFDPAFAAAVEGDVEASRALLAQPFDYIFFTGSVAVGRTVMESAAKRLIPVTLELGGKSPCIVHRDANLKLAAKRIAYGKLMNAGQTCVAPDYLLVHEAVKAEFVKALKDAFREFYGDNPIESERYGKIVNERHFDRVIGYLEGGGTVAHGGRYDRGKLKIEPTLIENVTWEQPVMQDEIFGPILPILTYDRIDEVINAVNERPKPLALYLFTADGAIERDVLGRISFGGGCVNDTLMHLGTSNLPFGGVGESGMGSYHGKFSFDTFSHRKSVLKQTTRFDLAMRYPSDKSRIGLLRKAMK